MFILQVALKDTDTLLDHSLIDAILKAGPTGLRFYSRPKISKFLAKLVGVHVQGRL
jgi:hypothetical protein